MQSILDQITEWLTTMLVSGIMGNLTGWYVAPHIINSFLEAYDFSGKTIVLFATSGGSDFGKTLEALEDSVRGTAHLMEGKMLNGKQDKEELKSWIDGLGL